MIVGPNYAKPWFIIPGHLSGISGDVCLLDGARRQVLFIAAFSLGESGRSRGGPVQSHEHSDPGRMTSAVFS